jgi:hypothetical protein
MRNDDDHGAANAGLGSGSLTDRRAALLKLLAASAGAYAVPLVASFSMGGLSLKAQTFSPTVGANQPHGGNQCFGGNQTFPPGGYRIGLDARYKLDGVSPKGYVPIVLLVRPDPGTTVSDADGWSSRATVSFYSKGSGLVAVTGDFTVIVSKVSSALTLLPVQFDSGKTIELEAIPNGVIRGGGPLTLLSPAIGGLKPSQGNSAPIKGIRVVFSATMDAPTAGCGVLSILSVKSPATLQVASSSTIAAIPSGQVPLATVPSGELP